ncbi:hypothetical protein GCM10025863_16810 [Microbacterium suwonense]|uniref:ROK family transcriptional regulator n=1 Tax=Microbacterium suwonense TaxID=683047 RepID=A0ABM8FTR3_9MICO|nr:ROK family transcriptional regulator [Microbacterium suwonense]BDZ39067.1 hypothetical protein GCM10025863_16810 [Microbacterium suwonense]
MESSQGERSLPVAAPGRHLRSATKALPEQARAHNRALMLQTLYHGGAMSRADLARETGLTRVTISDLVAESIADGIIHDIGVRHASGPGKPAIVIDIDREGHQIIGIDLSGTSKFEGAVLDLGGRVICRRSVSLPVQPGSQQTYRAASDLARELIAAATRPILGIGVGSPGVVRGDGTILSAPNLSWQDFPLEHLIAGELGLPAVVSNDADVALLAEYTFGRARSDVMLVRIGRGSEPASSREDGH